MINKNTMKQSIIIEEPIHDFFGLTYASYLVVPRSILQSMPTEWQSKFVALLNEVDNAVPTPTPDYEVRAKLDGKYTNDPYKDYHRGRRRVELKTNE